MAKKHVTLSIEQDIYKTYAKHCNEQGLILSKQVEMMLIKELERLNNEKTANRKVVAR